MGNVPVWVLVLNTLLVGGCGVLGAWLGFNGQREGRLLDVKRGDAAVMRDKASEIFAELGRIRQEGRQAVVQASVAAGDPETERKGAGYASMPNLDGLLPLVAVYFPSLLPVLDAYNEELDAALETIQPRD